MMPIDQTTLINLSQDYSFASFICSAVLVSMTPCPYALTQ